MEHRELPRIGGGDRRGPLDAAIGAEPPLALGSPTWPGVRWRHSQRPGLFIALATAGCAFLTGVGFLAVWAGRNAVAWLHHQPQYRIKFGQIRIDPEPPVWFRGGVTGFLAGVKRESGEADPIPLLDVRPDRLARAFMNDPWVEDVNVRYLPGGITVSIRYRQPVAYVQLESGLQKIVDEKGTILPDRDVDESASELRSLVRIAGKHLAPPSGDRAGVAWASENEASDRKILAAAKLAGFLATAHQRADFGASPPLRFIEINVSDFDQHGLFLFTGDGAVIWWRSPPGEETAGEPRAAEKWALLRDWAAGNEKRALREGDYWYFSGKKLKRTSTYPGKHQAQSDAGASGSQPARRPGKTRPRGMKGADDVLLRYEERSARRSRRGAGSGAPTDCHPLAAVLLLQGRIINMAGRLGPYWFQRVQQLAGPTHAGRMGRYGVNVERVNALEPSYERLSDAELTAAAHRQRLKARQGDSLKSLLVDTFALVREAAKRTIGQRHFDVQILGAIAIHNRCISELETGEGKTLVATMPATLNALPGKGVYIVTVNDYLARRDAEWMGPIYKMMGLTVGCIQTGQGDGARRAAYACDITYGTAKEMGFDFLRDELKRLQLGGDAHRKSFEQAFLGRGGHLETQLPVQRTHNYAIVDEADSILIDEARTPLIIGANNQPTQEEAAAYYGADKLAATLVRVKDYKYDPLERKAELTAAGRRKVQAKAANSEFVTLTVDGLYEYVERGLRAQIAYLKDRDYVTVDGEVIIVDEFTGRMMPGRQWQDGLHQAIQAKERLEITLETITAARVTVQDLFKRFNKLAGMTGTALSDARELRRIYKVGVFKVPTNRPCQRVWLADRIFSTSDERFQAVAQQIIEWNKKGVPVLVGTRSIEKSERLSALLEAGGIEHQILNAKNHEIEAQIVAQAGQRGRVTVATNMAGRGTDIKLGDGVAELGGLHVIGTERHEARRIDRQLAGRCARQGDPGMAQFFISLDDEIVEAYGEKRAGRIRKRMAGRGELTSLRTRGFFITAQRKKERQHYKDRKLLMHYEKQRAEMRKNMGLNPVLG
jgi:preprotein translocase subunit SecA